MSVHIVMECFPSYQYLWVAFWPGWYLLYAQRRAMYIGARSINYQETHAPIHWVKNKKYDGAIVIVVFLWSGINHVVHEKSLMTHIDNGKLEL